VHELRTVHVRHVIVDQNHVEFLRRLPNHRQGLLRIRRGHYVVPEPGEPNFFERADRLVVVHDEDALLGVGTGGNGAFGVGGRVLSGVGRQIDVVGDSLVRFIPHRHLPAVGVHDPEGHGEIQVVLVHQYRRTGGLPVVRRAALPRIAHSDVDVGPGIHVQVLPGQIRIGNHLPHGRVEHRGLFVFASLHAHPGVGHQVRHQLLELGGRAHHGTVFIVAGPEGESAREGRLREGQHLLHHRDHVDLFLPAPDVFLAEDEEMLDQGFDLPQVLQRVVEVILRYVILRDVLMGHL